MALRATSTGQVRTSLPSRPTASHFRVLLLRYSLGEIVNPSVGRSLLLSSAGASDESSYRTMNAFILLFYSVLISVCCGANGQIDGARIVFVISIAVINSSPLVRN